MQDETYQDHEDSESSSWMGEAGDSGKSEFIPSDSVHLPVGILKDGVIYRDLVIDELGGIDDHLVSDKKAGNNGAAALSLVICRSVQEVSGLLPRKMNPDKMFDRALARNMTQPDRDYLITRIFMLSERNEAIMAGKCSRCGSIWEETVLLSDLPVISWPDDKPREIEFELNVGFREMVDGKPVYHKKGKLRFPTGKEQELTGKLANNAEIVDAMIAACVIEAGTLRNVDQEQVKALKRRDRELLMWEIQHGLPGIQQWREVQCDCGNRFDIVLDLASFFAGRRRKMRR